jgi:hypothetical protein
MTKVQALLPDVRNSEVLTTRRLRQKFITTTTVQLTGLTRPQPLLVVSGIAFQSHCRYTVNLITRATMQRPNYNNPPPAHSPPRT